MPRIARLTRLEALGVRLLHPSANVYFAAGAWVFFGLVGWLNVQWLADVSTEPWYCLPIAVLAWWGYTRGAVIMAVLALVFGAGHALMVAPGTPGVFPPWMAVYRAASEAVLYGGTAFVIALARSQFDRLDASSRLLSRLAFHDRLTDLPNRQLLFERLATAMSQARHHSSKVGLLFLDLDGFKAINDRHGHKTGDDVLKAVAGRLLGAVRETDTVARVGGDEFVVVLCDIAGPYAAAAVAEKIIRSMAGPVKVRNGDSHLIGMSIGISLFPEGGSEMDSLLANADAAMYESKRKGKSCYTFFHDVPAAKEAEPWIAYDSMHAIGVAEIDEQHKQLMVLANRLNSAVKAGESAEIVSRLFDELVLYAQFHFSTEERLMQTYGYPAHHQHRTAHAQLVEEVGHLRERLNHGGELLALQTIKDWLLVHIDMDDRPLGLYLNQSGMR